MKARRLMLVVALLLLVGVVAIVGLGTAFAAGSGPQVWGPGTMMRGVSGMMGGNGQGMMGAYGRSAATQGPAITLDQAVKSVQANVDQTGNKDLAIDEVMEFQNNYYAIVKEKSTGTGAFEVLVDKTTGNVFPEMGPNMMWNTKYGMHTASGSNGLYGGMTGRMQGMMGQGGMMDGGAQGMMGGQYPITGPTGPMTVTSDQAKTLAQQWLDQNQPGSTTETPDQFYGYYTVHTLKDGKVSGMLSVNGYTGQVWYHSWHGAFVELREMGK